jgi:hypothetical protein
MQARMQGERNSHTFSVGMYINPDTTDISVEALQKTKNSATI